MHNREGKLNQKSILPSPFYTSLRQNGGGERDRTDDLLRARQALSQLSYTPGQLYKMKSVKCKIENEKIILHFTFSIIHSKAGGPNWT